MLAITKIDLADEELLDQLKDNLPVNVPYLFISSVQQKGLIELKDLLWKTLTMPVDPV